MKIDTVENVDETGYGEEQDFINPAEIPSISEVARNAIVEVEQKTKETTPTGRKSKTAKDAEEVKLLISTCQSFFEGVHEFVTNKFGDEFKHKDEEITVLSVLTANVINKYVDLNGAEYKEEIQLATYLIGKEFPKISAFVERKREEKKEKKEKNG